jgi:hypothetical protein
MSRQKTELVELFYLFRMMQLFHEFESIDKISRMLIALTTFGDMVGFKRSIIFAVDEENGIIKGVMGCDKSDLPARGDVDGFTFEECARMVFECFDRTESTNTTLQTRAFSVPLDTFDSALVKAHRTSYPVLAEAALSEFKQDPFFASFNTDAYVAVPLVSRFDEGFTSGAKSAFILAADKGPGAPRIRTHQVSLLFSLAQQASLAMKNLVARAESGRRMRVMKKLTRILASDRALEKFEGSLRLAMTMLCTAVGASGCIFKDFSRNKTIHIKPVRSFSLAGDDRDVSVGGCFDSILERAATRMRTIVGDSTHPLLVEEAAVDGFIVSPLRSAGDVMGAVGVYVHKGGSRKGGFSSQEITFFEICARLIASAVGERWMLDRAARSDDMLEEFRSNMMRERSLARLGQRGIAYARNMEEMLERLEKLLKPYCERRGGEDALSALILEMKQETSMYRDESRRNRSKFEMLDLFRIVDEIASSWAQALKGKRVKVDVSIPKEGPRLLMDREKISLAVRNILECVGSSLIEGDKARIECEEDDGAVRIVVADTGQGLPGDLLSRLFMPFRDAKDGDEKMGALSLAGDVISSHGGEIFMRSSVSWKTILVLSFKKAANRDRRRSTRDRRTGRRDRRKTTEKV